MRYLLLFGVIFVVVSVACGRFDRVIRSTLTPVAQLEVTQTIDPSAASPTPDPVSTRHVPIDSPVGPKVKVYSDTKFGFEVDYPSDWEATELREPSSLGLIGQIGSADSNGPQSLLYLTYETSLSVSPDSAVDNLISQFLTKPGFRQLTEEDLTLRDGTPAFRISFEWNDTEEALKSSVFGVVRGVQTFVIVTHVSKGVYGKHKDNIHNFLSSFRLVDAKPFGVSRNQALTLYLNDGPVTLDPAISQETKSLQYIAQIFSGLITFDSDLNIKPDVASGWKISNKGKTYTFTINEKARFHDGRPLIANDVKYSWERAGNTDDGSATSKAYLDDIVGMKNVFDGTAENATGIEVLDDRTLRVNIDAPKAHFLSKLSHPSTYVVDRQNVEQGPYWWTKPNGTGPFKLKGWDYTTLFVLEANSDYHGVPPRIPFVIFKLYGGDPILMYESGEIDGGNVYVEDVVRLTNKENLLKGKLSMKTDMTIHYVGFVSDKEPFNDPLVRKAFMLAIDRSKLITDIYKGTKQVAQGFLPPGLPGYNPSAPPIPFNPKEASRLLAISTYGGPEGLPPLVYTSRGTSKPPEDVIKMIEMWRENLGVEVKVRLLDPTTYFYRLNDRVDNLFTYGWSADFPDPQNFLYMLFRTGVPNNVGNYSNQVVDDLLDAAQFELDTAQRLALYRRAEHILVQEAAAIPFHFGGSYFLVKPHIKNLNSGPLGYINLSEAYFGK